MGRARGRQGPARTERLNETRRDGYRERGLSVTRLETFVDAAFAFALTLIVIGAGERPTTYTDLQEALHRTPTFLACFALIATFWYSHERFSRRFGLEDTTTVFLSLVLVACVMIWVYPLRMVISSGFWFLSGGWVPTELEIRSVGELQIAFRVFSAGFIVLGLLLMQLNRHALACADELGLDALERLETRGEIERHCINVGVAALSFIITFALTETHIPWLVGAPGFIYSIISPLMWVQTRRMHRLRAALG